MSLTIEDFRLLEKVVNIDKSESAAYEVNGKVYSTYQRNEIALRLNVPDSKEVYMFIFTAKGKVRARIKGTL